MKIVKENKQMVYNITQDQRDTLKKALTYDNPAYKQAKRYSRCKYISIPPHLTYYTEKSVSNGDGTRSKMIEVPIGVDVEKILEVKAEIEDRRAEIKVEFPKFELDLRKDQQIAMEHYLSEQHNNHPKNLVQLPTGKGKSILALKIASVLGVKTLILVHKDDLVVGWQKDIKLCYPTMKSGLIKAKKREIGEHITIATVQTLSRMSEEELSQYTSQFGLVVQDECHHVGLKIFNIIDKFNSKYKLGLTATPKRSDKLDFVFDLFFGGLCYKHIITDDDEDICGVEVRTLRSPFKYRPFVYGNQIFNYYDFKPSELPQDINFLETMDYKSRPTVPFLTIDNEVVKSKQTKIMVCKKILEHYKLGHSIIALFTQKEHIVQYYKYLCRFIPKEQIILYYGDAKEKSEVLMERAEKKESLITLATYAKATEGTNVKSWEVEFLVSSLNNEKNVEQATGRIRRRKDGKLSPVIVYDVCYDDCYSVRGHFSTRLNVYKRLQYKLPKTQQKGIFSRGYNLTIK